MESFNQFKIKKLLILYELYKPDNYSEQFYTIQDMSTRLKIPLKQMDNTLHKLNKLNLITYKKCFVNLYMTKHDDEFREIILSLFDFEKLKTNYDKLLMIIDWKLIDILILIGLYKSETYKKYNYFTGQHYIYKNYSKDKIKRKLIYFTKKKMIKIVETHKAFYPTYYNFSPELLEIMPLLYEIFYTLNPDGN